MVQNIFLVVFFLVQDKAKLSEVLRIVDEIMSLTLIEASPSSRGDVGGGRGENEAPGTQSKRGFSVT